MKATKASKPATYAHTSKISQEFHFKTKKKSKNSYRFLFSDAEKAKWSSFRLKSNKSNIDLIKFNTSHIIDMI